MTTRFEASVHEEELDRSPMERMSGPVVPDKPVAVPDESKVQALLKVTDGRRFQECRDRAVIRLMIDCGLRRSEVAGRQARDVDLDGQVVLVHGKGGHENWVPFGAKATAELDRYLRVRRLHPHASDTALFIGQYGGLTSNAVYQMLHRRCAQAGIHLHPTNCATSSPTPGSRRAVPKRICSGWDVGATPRCSAGTGREQPTVAPARRIAGYRRETGSSSTPGALAC
jgi:site-specific recombinase XerC